MLKMSPSPETPQSLKAAKIRVSVIGLSAEVRVCTVLARETGGTYLGNPILIRRNLSVIQLGPWSLSYTTKRK